MKSRALTIVAALAYFCTLSSFTGPLFAKPGPQQHVCGVPLGRSSLIEPPSVDVSQLPLDDLGRHEIILRVAKDGDRFCYRYTLSGVAENVAPLLVTHRGERFALRLANEISGPAAGSTMPASALPPCKPQMMSMSEPVQHFRGYMNHTVAARHMKIATADVNMHFHGFQGPASEENVFLSTLSTPEHACEYVVTIPRTQPPGTYLYHPHAHGAAELEVAGGLSGMWIVEPDTPQIPQADDHAVLLQYRVPFVNNYNFVPNDLALDFASMARLITLKPRAPLRFDPFDPPAWPSSLAARFGNVALPRCGDREGVLADVNGMDTPVRITVPAGVTQLFRVLNVTSDSVYTMHLRDAQGNVQTMQIVGRDGTPVGGDMQRPLSRYEALKTMQLVPFSRMDMLLTLNPGQVLTLSTDPVCIAPSDEVHVKQDFLTIAGGPLPAVDPPAITSEPIDSAQSPAAALVAYAHAHPQLIRRRAITYSEYVIPNANHRGGHGEYYITETSRRHFHEQPFWPDYRNGAVFPQAQIRVKHGTIEEWYLFNTTLEEHSFHMHQMNFVAENTAGGPAIVDTVLIPVGKVLPDVRNPDFPLIKPSLTRVLLDFRHVPRGTFVFHCHMLFHEDRGMMAVLHVE